MNCKFCNKECKNKNSKAQHEIRCNLNIDKIQVKSNFIKYNKDIKNNIVKKENTNQFTKALNLCAEQPIVSIETRNKLSKTWFDKKLSEQHKTNISKGMKKAVIDNPESYSCSNVSGRAKLYDYRGVKLKGTWELLVAQSLDAENIKWVNVITPIPYIWNNRQHLYFPDFYLIELDLFIEVKGYKRDRDECKWAVVNNLCVIERKEIKAIKKSGKISDLLYVRR